MRRVGLAESAVVHEFKERIIISAVIHNFMNMGKLKLQESAVRKSVSTRKGVRPLYKTNKQQEVVAQKLCENTTLVKKKSKE